MNLSAEILGVLERALKERYEAGLEDGHRAGRLDASVDADEAHAKGYAQAMYDVASWAQGKMEGWQARLVAHDVSEEPEPETLHLSPAKAKIVAFVEGNPGVTAAEIRRVCGGSNSAVYDLYKLGLVSKTGRQFFPAEANP